MAEEKGGAFDALFAAAEASIDRLAEKKRAEQGLDPAPSTEGETVKEEPSADPDVPIDEDDEAATAAESEPGEPSEVEADDEPAPAPRPIVNPIHRKRSVRPMPTRKTPRLVTAEPAEPKANTANAAVTQSLIKARNELTDLLEAASKANQALAAEKGKLELRVEKLKANQETSRQRAARERQDAVAQAREKVLKTFLPVVDNLERAMAAELGEMSPETAEKIASFRTGVDNVLRLFVSSLKKMNVEGYSAVGEIFDPNVHEAIRKVEDASQPANTVVEEYHKGYLLEGRLLRPAMVVVATGGPTPAE